MTIIEYEAYRLEIPDKWEENKLAKYDQFHGKRPESFRERVALLLDICGIDPESLMSAPTEIFNRIVQITAFIFAESNVKGVPFIVVEDIKYIVSTEESLTLGEWIDIEEVQKAGDNVLSNVLAIVCRPAGEEYDYRNNDKRQKMFANLPVSSVLGVLGFFLQQKQLYEKVTIEFLTLLEIAELLPPNTELLRSLGGGIGLLKTWRAVKFWILKELLNYQLRRYSRILFTYKTKRGRKRHKGN